MTTRAALTAGTFASLAVTAAWSYTATLTIGPMPPLVLGRSPAADYARLAAAPTGNGATLFAVIAVVYALCLFASGWRHLNREEGE